MKLLAKTIRNMRCHFIILEYCCLIMAEKFSLMKKNEVRA